MIAGGGSILGNDGIFLGAQRVTRRRLFQLARLRCRRESLFDRFLDFPFEEEEAPDPLGNLARGVV